MPMEWLKEHFRTTRDAYQPQRALERYKMGMKSGGSIKAVRVLVGPESCPSCRSLADRVYALDQAPVLPNPSCTSPGGCRCAYRPVMAYDPALKSLEVATPSEKAPIAPSEGSPSGDPPEEAPAESKVL